MNTAPPRTYSPAYKNNAVILASVSGLLVGVALLLNVFENNQAIYIPLFLTAAVALLTFLIASHTEHGLAALVLMSVSLMCLGVYLLFAYDPGTQAKLFWFLLFPPMLMLCLGLWYGTLLFLLFFTFLLAAFFSPVSNYLANDYPPAVNLRFLAAMFGAWVFSWLSEYARYRTQQALQRAMERLEHDALTDSLTGLGNRRDFQAFFNWVQIKALRDQKSFCLILIDIDHFKAINDRHGHEVGDAVLRHTALVLGEHLRADARLFRWGGEEFIALLSETPFESACVAAERLRRSIMETPYRNGDLRIEYSISLGLYCGGIAEEMRKQVAAADGMLYTAKNHGRNQVQSLRRRQEAPAPLPGNAGQRKTDSPPCRIAPARWA